MAAVYTIIDFCVLQSESLSFIWASDDFKDVIWTDETTIQLEVASPKVNNYCKIYITVNMFQSNEKNDTEKLFLAVNFSQCLQVQM